MKSDLKKSHLSLSWEMQFPEAALKTEEFIFNHPDSVKTETTLHIALRKHFLNWSEYSTWFSQKNNCTILKSDLSIPELFDLNETYHNNNKDQDLKSTTDISNSIHFAKWNNKNIVIGIGYSDNLMLNSNNIFILCSVACFDFLLQNQLTKSTEVEFWQEKLNFFKNQETEYRKKYDAFCIVKSNRQQTSLLYMDEELSKEIQDHKVFNIDLTKTSPLQQKLLLQERGLISSDMITTFDCEKDQFKVLDFSKFEVQPLFLGTMIVGYFIGFTVDSKAQVA